MSPARTLLMLAPALALLAWISPPPSYSQSESQAPTRQACERQRQNNEELDPRCIDLEPRGYPCRVHWQEQTYGGDTLASTGVFQLQRSAPQMDGSVVYMGQGQVDIVFTPGGGCTATRGANTRMPMMIIVTSEDGRTATVDIGQSYMGVANPRDAGEFPVAVSCPGGHNSEMDVGVSTPPSLELPLQDGASASYDDNSTHSWGNVGGQRGTIRLEFCRPQ